MSAEFRPALFAIKSTVTPLLRSETALFTRASRANIFERNPTKSFYQDLINAVTVNERQILPDEESMLPEKSAGPRSNARDSFSGIELLNVP